FLGNTATPYYEAKQEWLPDSDLTISAVFTVEQRQRYGGILGVQEDNGPFEKGWVLGYNLEGFYVAISTEGTDDGDGKMVFVQSKTQYELGKWYHVAATYDGKVVRLFVNGKLEQEDDSPKGAIVYPEKKYVAVLGYRDQNEDYPHKGRALSVQAFGSVASPKWIQEEAAHFQEQGQAPAEEAVQDPLSFRVKPYLQWGTTEGMTIMWEVNRPNGKGIVHYGETAQCLQTIEGQRNAKGIHEVRVAGLKPGTQYFYRVETIPNAGLSPIQSEVKTFQTDAGAGVPFAFAVISDTQGNPAVSGAVAKMAWEQRPNFLLHPGDLVSTGKNKSHWVDHYFASMEPLISRVPFFPVLGNHEQNADHYYDYMSLPDPEYYYTYQYGDAQFFMIDTNKKCGPDSEQYQWLKAELAKSKALWKFVCHHHPPYSSDENDYGDLWKQNQSSRGDRNARLLTELYDQFEVDIVWNGHIHSYERTWPIHDGKASVKKGPIYLITGGGGGHLETPGPFRTPFQLLVKRGHHYAMVWIHQSRLEFKAYDLEGQLFDSFSLEK
ncbi:MAG: metallophosphoesterase, partial [Verrucomicrobiota bacterium]